MEQDIHREEMSSEVVIRRDPPREYTLLARVVYFAVDVVEILLALRFLLRAFGADAAGFGEILYRLTGPLVAPFLAIFPAASLGGVLVEWGTLLAMAVYVLLGMLIVRFLRILLVR